MSKEMRESPRGKSMISLYIDCPRRWAWKYLRGFKSIMTPEYLIFGSCIHEAQEVYYLTWDIDAAIERALEFLSTAVMPDEWRIPITEKVAFTLATWYEEIGRFDSEEMEVLAVEREVNLSLPNNFSMSMRWDRVLRDKEADEIFVSDTKTTGWSYTGTVQNYMVSAQPFLYVLSAFENEPDWRANLSGWRTDCLYVRPLKRGGYSHEFGRSEVTRPAVQVMEDCRNSFASYTSSIKWALDGVAEGDPISVNFPRNFGNCVSFGKKCPFIPICHRIDNMDMPPEGMEIDSWLEERVVLDSFKEVI